MNYEVHTPTREIPFRFFRCTVTDHFKNASEVFISARTVEMARIALRNRFPLCLEFKNVIITEATE